MELTARYSRWRNALWGGGYLLTAVGLLVFLATNPASGRAPWLVGGFLLLITAVPLIEHGRAIFNTEVQLTINDEGIFYRAWGEPVLWAQLVLIRPRTRRRLGELEVVTQTDGRQQLRLLDLRFLDVAPTAVIEHLRHYTPAQKALQQGTMSQED